MTENNAERGVWMIGHFDWNWITESVHATEIEALRIVNGRGYGEVHFLPFGTETWEAATALLTAGRDRAGEGAAFREGECTPRKCSCMGHVVPGVEHFTPCCDEPHVTAGEGAGS